MAAAKLGPTPETEGLTLRRARPETLTKLSKTKYVQKALVFAREFSYLGVHKMGVDGQSH